MCEKIYIYIFKYRQYHSNENILEKIFVYIFKYRQYHSNENILSSFNINVIFLMFFLELFLKTINLF